MTAKKIRKPLAVLAVITSFVGVLVLLILTGYRLIWTGFLNKTLWDWLQLLIIPAVLAIGGYLFTFTTSRNERKAADKHNQTEREIAQDNQREAALQAYVDKMSELLLHEKLRASQPEDEVRTIARARTLTILPQLDAQRKGSVIQFLSESKLVEIVSLSGVNLSGAELLRAHLVGANLSGADLSGANLSGVALNGADLRYALLGGANLRGAELVNSNLVGADLHNANLHNANLRGAKVAQEQLGTAIGKPVYETYAV